MLSTIWMIYLYTMEPPLSPVCQQNLNTFIRLCSKLGVPLAPNKVEGPSTTLTFLGIILDTQNMEVRLPQEKLIRIQVKLETWLKKHKKLPNSRRCTSLPG